MNPVVDHSWEVSTWELRESCCRKVNLIMKFQGDSLQTICSDIFCSLIEPSKGQLISKINCQAEDSPKKRTNEFVFTTVRRVFVPFWENPRLDWFAFEINWPLTQNLVNSIFSLYKKLHCPGVYMFGHSFGVVSPLWAGGRFESNHQIPHDNCTWWMCLDAWEV